MNSLSDTESRSSAGVDKAETSNIDIPEAFFVPPEKLKENLKTQAPKLLIVYSLNSQRQRHYTGVARK